jgi:primary-amine oxidase
MVRGLERIAVVVSALLLTGGTLKAQQATAASAAMIEKALGKLEVPFAKTKDSYTFKLDGRPTVLRSAHDGEKLLIKTALPERKASLQTINRYNEERAFTTRAVQYATEGVVLEAGLDCRLGVTPKGVMDFIAGFGQDVRQFDAFLADGGKAPGNQLPEGVAEAADPPGKQSVAERAADKPVAPGSSAGSTAPIPLTLTPGTDDREILIEFPTTGGAPRETAWKIIWGMETGERANKQGFKFPIDRANALVLFKIKKAFFRPGAKAGWLQVLEDAHPSEFFVPYVFQNTRFFDLRDVGDYVSLDASEGGARSRLLGKDHRVMAELRDRGLAYKHGNVTRRGEELVLWANFAAGNYTYLIEFCFHDDGTIAFKHAPTGYNYLDHFDPAAHMHNCLWRIGVKLGPYGKKANNQVSLIRLPYDPNRLGPDGKLDIVPISAESAHDWKATEFTRIRVTNPGYTVFPQSDTKPQLPISYDLVPLMQGSARHLRNKDEAFSLHDFWITRADCPEKMYIHLPDYFAGRANARPLAGSDGVVLWHTSSALHVPRGEDGIYAGNNLDNGQALVSYTTVELRPRNLFLRTPLYPPKREE